MQKKLPALFSKALEEELGPIITPMETAMRDACHRLETSYPRVEITIGGTAHISSDSKGLLLKGAIGGGALVVGGLGVASAASAAIAGLAATVITSATVAPGAALAAGGLSTLAPFVGFYFGGTTGAAVAGTAGTAAAAAITAAGTTTATTTVAAVPSALLVAAGPIGWTIAGIGAAAIPLAWGLARKKRKEDMRAQVAEQVKTVFCRLRSERLAAIRAFGPKIVEEFRVNLDRRLAAIDTALRDIAAKAGDPASAQEDQRRFTRLSALLSKPPALS